MTHTHEVWIGKKDPNVETQIAFKGDYIKCFGYVDEIAKMDQMGAGFLLTNGNYDIVELEAERKLKVLEAGPEMLERLKINIEVIESILKKDNLIGMLDEATLEILAFNVAANKRSIKKATL